VCGSRHIVLVGLPMAGELLPVAGGSDEGNPPRLRWRCRRCRTSMGYHVDAGLWQRRHPLANWLFSGRR
jgi:hypothetical protein